MALILLVGIARSGARYFYCPIMGATFERSCCAPAEHDSTDPRDDASVGASECCETRHVGSLPTADAASALELRAVPFEAIEPPLSSIPIAREDLDNERLTHPARAGPPSAAERRAQLMIWTC